MANAWESAPIVEEPKSKKATPTSWDEINAETRAAQPKRDSERLAILEQEYAEENNPANRAALAREIKTAGGTADKKAARPAWMDAPEVASEQQSAKASAKQPPPQEKKVDTTVSDIKSATQSIGNLAAGLVRGAGSIGATLLWPIDKATDIIKGDRDPSITGLVTGKQPLSRNEERRQQIDEGLRTMGADPDSLLYKGGKLAGEIAGTAGAGGALANGVRAVAPGAAGLANALASGGFSTGNSLARTASLGAKAADLGTRVAGGAVTGGVSAGMVNPGDAATGAAIGGGLPVLAKLAGYGGNAISSAVRPFFSKGQDLTIKNALSELAENPAALSAMQNAREVIPGSVPTSVMASGDIGLAGLSRTMQSTNPKYAIDLANRQYAQNAARTAALEEVAGNAGKLAAAKEVRDAATSAMREDVLKRAGVVQSEPVLNSIDRLIKDPNNAGKLPQQALNEFRGRIEQFSQDGGIDARALYAIRKDINEVLGGKLQGEAGNLRHASGQLIKVKGLIDDAIDKASRAVPQSASREVAPFNGYGISAITQPSNKGPAATWSQYLEEYSKQSKPIEQMEILDDLMKRIQTGSVDKQGNLILSAAKLNNILKNETPDLVKKLTPDQLKLVRNLSADLNASQLAGNAGKSPGSETVQKLGTHSILTSLMGNKLGGSSPVTNTLGRAMQIPYGYANKQMMEKMGDALLDPAELTRIMNTKEGSELLRRLSRSTSPAIYRAAPVISAQ